MRHSFEIVIKHSCAENLEVSILVIILFKYIPIPLCLKAKFQKTSPF